MTVAARVARRPTDHYGHRRTTRAAHLTWHTRVVPREHELATFADSLRATTVFLAVRFRDDLPLPVVELVERHRYRDDPPVERKSVAVPLTALDVVVPYFERRLEVPAAQRAGSPFERLVGCLTTLAAAGVPREHNDVTGGYNCDHVTQVAAGCLDAGVAHEVTTRVLVNGPPAHIRRHPLLRVRPPHEGYARMLWLELSADDGRAGAVRFHESYKHPRGQPFHHSVTVDYAGLGPLLGVVESRLDTAAHTADAEGATPAGGVREARLVAALQALIERRELGDALPHGHNRDLVRTWCEEAGLSCRIDARRQYFDVFEARNTPDGETLSLGVNFGMVGGQDSVEFSQVYYPPRSSKTGWDREPTRTRVIASFASVTALVPFFERRLGLPAQPATEQRLVECFTAIVERRELGAPLDDGLPARSNADRVAGWFTAAGVPYEIRRELRHVLLRTYHADTDCFFVLRMSLHTRLATAPDASAPVRHTVVSFSEFYNYLPRRGDPGRDYGYSSSIPEAPTDRLVEFFERHLGLPATTDNQGDARIIACFDELVHRGVLADGLRPEANRNRVAEILAATGLPVKTDHWHWFNSD